MENLSPIVHGTWIQWAGKQPSKASRLTAAVMEEKAEPAISNKPADDLIGYTTLKLKVLQVAAQELLDVWKVSGDNGEYSKLIQAFGRLADAMKRTGI